MPPKKRKANKKIKNKKCPEEITEEERLEEYGIFKDGEADIDIDDNDDESWRNYV